MVLRTGLLTGLLSLWFLSCNNKELSDAYGHFETDKITISSQLAGELLWFSAEEGMKLEQGQDVAVIDTSQIHLKKEELLSTMASVRTNLDKLDAQAAVYEAQLNTAQKELKRLQALKADKAATQQQIDQVEGQVNALQKQMEVVQTEKQSVYAELDVIRVKIAQVEDQLKKARVTNPINGTVLRTFAEAGEFMTPGKALYEIGSLEELVLKVYLSGAQLSAVRLGQQVEVLFDKDADNYSATQGQISWIASEAEFTPQTIQTKEERVTQVYAVEVRVPNPDGKLKIGMPGEVNFN